jgi:hypothetical protein
MVLFTVAVKCGSGLACERSSGSDAWVEWTNEELCERVYAIGLWTKEY